MTRRPSIAKLYLDAAAAAETEHAERRRLVLAKGNEDLAKRLTQWPLGYTRPEQWTGYIPPHMTSGPHQWHRNDSPQRVHLVAIVHTAMQRTYGHDAAKAWLDETNTDRWSGPWTPHHVVEGD